MPVETAVWGASVRSVGSTVSAPPCEKVEDAVGVHAEHRKLMRLGDSCVRW